ncbi:MAG: ribosomal-processing cysteine protease Prp [Oscillospiraceae bacterium]|nr:ribosomal-processing cysteine protease Prp [Oscillospiraceae bacterium]
MTIAEFYRKNGELTGFKVKGHSGYAKQGSDIVCASVSSAVMLTANLITEIFGYNADVSAVGDTVALKTYVSCDETLQRLYKGLVLQLEEIASEFEGNLKVQFTEV